MKKKNLFAAVALFSMTLGLASCTSVNFDNVVFKITKNQETFDRMNNLIDGKRTRKDGSFDERPMLRMNEEFDIIEISSSMFRLSEYKYEMDHSETKATFLVKDLLEVQARLLNPPQSAEKDENGEVILSAEETYKTYKTFLSIRHDNLGVPVPYEFLESFSYKITPILDHELIGILQAIPIDIVTPLTEDTLKVESSAAYFLITDEEIPYINSNEEPLKLEPDFEYNSKTPEKDLQKFNQMILDNETLNISDLGTRKDLLKLHYFKTLEDAENNENALPDNEILEFAPESVKTPFLRYVRVVDGSGNISENVGVVSVRLKDKTAPELRHLDGSVVTVEDLGTIVFEVDTFGTNLVDGYLNPRISEKLNEIMINTDIYLHEEVDGHSLQFDEKNLYIELHYTPREVHLYFNDNSGNRVEFVPNWTYIIIG